MLVLYRAQAPPTPKSLAFSQAPEQLGLKLIPAKAQVEVVVIDSIGPAIRELAPVEPAAVPHPRQPLSRMRAPGLLHQSGVRLFVLAIYGSVGGAKLGSSAALLASSMLHFQSPKVVFQHVPSAFGSLLREQLAPGLSSVQRAATAPRLPGSVSPSQTYRCRLRTHPETGCRP